MIFKPINPMLTGKGAIASLVDFFPEETVVPINLDRGEDPFKSFSVKGSSISINAAAKLNISSIFSASTGFDSKAFVFDAIAYTDKYLEIPAPDKMIVATRWGAGIRMAVRAYNIKSDFNLAFSSVGAAVELGFANAEYEITGLGLGITALGIILKDIPTVSNLTSHTVVKLETTVMKNLVKHIEENKSSISPVPIALALKEAISDPIADAQSIFFAMKNISKGKSLSTVLDRAGMDYKEKIIKEVYFEVAGSIPPGDKPSEEAINIAVDWLNV